MGIVVLCANGAAAAWGGVAWLRKEPSIWFWYLLRAAQVTVVAQVAIGMWLLISGNQPQDELHYLYGALALGAALSPWLYAPPVPARRLAWFVGATLFATALAVRAYTTS